MKDHGHAYVTPQELRKGLYIELDLGWMAHPFPKGSFKITTSRQIETLRELGLPRIRYLPAKSDPLPDTAELKGGAQTDTPPQAAKAPDFAAQAPGPEEQEGHRHASLLAAQQRSLAFCDEQFGLAIALYRNLEDQLESGPKDAAAKCQQMVDALVGDMLGQSESSIRLLSEGMGDRASMHPVNVTVLSLLLGKALKLPFEQLRDLGMAALLHDIGKSQLPDRIRWMDSSFSPEEGRQYQSHVAHGVLLARQLSLSPPALSAMAQHHELADGSGFPRQTKGESISLGGKILALVNLYENMCNPARPSAAVTPHEALSQIFSQMRLRFDATVLGAFIRMMGVYPPGSVVQLSDSRYALVVSVNSTRPLKPQVIVHDPDIASREALIMNLENVGAPGIRRSLKPGSLPRAAIDYLSPRARICYFFERAIEPGFAEAPG
ncbi:MAG: HD domain-containing phosphohydrolase [Burkholderiaceae bacterium]